MRTKDDDEDDILLSIVRRELGSILTVKENGIMEIQKNRQIG